MNEVNELSFAKPFTDLLQKININDEQPLIYNYFDKKKPVF
jgi:hypothetical protein